MARYLVYNFSGELDDFSHLFPNERLARIAALIKQLDEEVELLDRANTRDLLTIGADYLENLGELGFHDTNPQYEAGLVSEAEYLLARRYDTIFLNLWHGTGFKFSMDLARLLKARQPALHIFGVGQKVDWFKESILRMADNVLDGLVLGLGYNAIAGIVQGRDLTELPNMVLNRDGVVTVNPQQAIDVDDYPFGSYDADIYRNIAWKLPLHTVSLSNQACPNQCVFCVRPANYGRKSITRRVELVLQELRESYEKYGIRYFRFEDSTPPRLALTHIADAIVHSELHGKIRFSAFSRIDTNGEEDFPLLKEAGCLALFFGVESMDDGNLQRLRKGIAFAAIRDTIARAHAAGIRTLSNFIMPIPGETRESFETTFSRLTACKEIFDSVLTLPAGVYPPTAWGADPAQYGIILGENYLERLITYPIKYLFPLSCMPPLPFSYPIMGKPAEAVSSEDIVAVHDEFRQRVREELRIPAIPDYGFLVADYLQQPPADAIHRIVSGMMARDYPGLEALLIPAPDA